MGHQTAVCRNNDRLLLATLKTIWHNYLQAANDSQLKHHWIRLFLFYAQYVNDDFYTHEENKSFFNPIPEEICSFLLEQVYEIISESELFAPLQDEDGESPVDPQREQNSKKATKLSKLLRKNHNFAQLILRTPSDCNKIVALRTFLTHKLGQHLLDFLLRVDCKLIASQKSVCNLCINLFPDCPWNENAKQLLRAEGNTHNIGSLRLYQKAKSSPKHPVAPSQGTRSSNTGTTATGVGATGAVATGKEATGAVATGTAATGAVATGVGATGVGATGVGATGALATGAVATGTSATGAATTGTTATGAPPNEPQQSQVKADSSLEGSDEGEEREDSLDSDDVIGASEDFCQALEQFDNNARTSDEIAYMLIQLLGKCVSSDSGEAATLTEHSISVVSLNFALDWLRVGRDEAFSSHDNAVTIKFELLRLAEQCLNNIFADEHNVYAIQFQNVYAKLLAAIDSNLTAFNQMLMSDEPAEMTLAAERRAHAQILYGLNHVMFSVLHNVTAVYTANSRPGGYHGSKFLANSAMKFIDEQTIDICVDTLKQLLMCSPAGDAELQATFAGIYKILLKTIDNLCKYEQLMQPAATNQGHGSTALPLGATKPRRKKSYVRQVHCSTPSLSCHFQAVLFQLMPYLGVELHEYSIKYLLRAGTCCCNYTLDNFETCLQFARRMAPALQRCAYKFLYRKILNAIFVRNNTVSGGGGDRRSAGGGHCGKCDAKLKSLDFHSGILEQYRHVYEQLIVEEAGQSADPMESLNTFLKHLRHIWHLLTNDIAAGVLAEIVLPAFRKYKALLLLLETSKAPLKDPESGAKGKAFWPSYRPRSSSDSSNPSTSSSSTGSGQATAKRPPDLHLQLPPAATSTSRLHYLRTLQECLNIFVIYMSDLRLIKAYYNEENISHLEELLGEPELIRGICDLIKIGIDNLTFLGDNSHEQAALSRRLITLQLNSSDHAARMFNGLLQRFARCSRMARERFWLDEGTADNEEEDSVNPLSRQKPLDVLHCAAMQWSLNYDLLKTSQYFYNEFAKIYSIVMEEDDEDAKEGDEDNTVDTEPDPPKGSKPYLKHGDKTIIDILKLNYNALSSFLIFPRKRKAAKGKTNSTSPPKGGFGDPSAHIYTLTPMDFQPLLAAGGDGLSLSSSLETLVSSFDYGCLTASTMSSLPDGGDGGLKDICGEEGASGGGEASSFLQRLQLQQLDESIVLFDIRNQRHDQLLQQQNHHQQQQHHPHQQQHHPNHQQQHPNHQQQHHYHPHQQQNNQHHHQHHHPSEVELVASTTSAALTAACPVVAAAANATATVVDPKTGLVNVPDTDDGIISKLFSMFGSLFSGSRSNSIIDLRAGKKSSHHQSGGVDDEEDAEEIDADLECFYESGGECKKLVLKLFEATMAICIKGYQNEEVEKMQKHLRKLRAIILSNATANWPQYAAEQQVPSSSASAQHATRDNTIVQALQTLLKIAELSSNTLNEPTAIVDNSSTLYPGNTREEATGSTLHATSSALQSRARGRGRRSHTIQAQQQSAHLEGGLVAPNVLASPVSPSTGSADGDYFSTRASIICADSEVELSASDNDGSGPANADADEGYEADGEIHELSDSDGDLEATDLFHSLQPSSRYRSHIVHNGLCRLVVDILIELAELCTRNPVGWSDNLAQLANRLYVIREYLGGSLFLLRGFAPVLESSDPRLKDLQQSILELIVDLNTPDLLFTYFGILASKNPPADLLIRRMNYICSAAFKKAKACTELEFPVALDGKCLSGCDPGVTERIERMRNQHLQQQTTTPFTRSPCIIPVNNTLVKLWHNDGFTVSTWFQVKKAPSHKSSSQLIDEDNRSATDDYLKTHLLSVGSNQAMLSVYLTSNMNLSLESCKPNAEVQLPMRSPASPSDETQVGAPSAAATTTTVINHTTPTSHTNKHISKATASGQPGGSSTSPPQAPGAGGKDGGGSSSLRNAFKHTRQVLLNSFSNMHLFNGHGDSNAYYEGGSVELKGHRLSRNKWTHLVLAVEMQNDQLEVTVFIDGLNEHSVRLPSCHLRSRMDTFQVVALGDASCTVRAAQASNSESRSTLDSFPMRVGFSNLMLFDRRILARQCILNLAAMGPDFAELTQCKVSTWRPNYGYLNLSKMAAANFGNHEEAMQLLKEHRVLTYSAQQADIVMTYMHLTEMDNTLSFGKDCVFFAGRPNGLIRYGELQPVQLQSIHTAVSLSGGLSCLAYLFARVVEVSANAVTQSMALDLLLTVALSDNQLYAEFQQQDYMSLVGYVVKTERCSKDVHLLKSIVNNACSQPVITKKGDVLQVNENTTANIAYPEMLIVVVHRYSDWHRSGAEHSHVLDMFFAAILALTRDKHPHRDFNIEQLQRVGLIRELLNLCKVYVIESPNPVHISRSAAQSFVSILAVFAGSPPSPSLMDEIMKLLLLLHKPSECYVTHDRSKFYFLLTAQSPVKEKFIASANLSRVAAPFRRNFVRSRPGVATATTPATAASPVSPAPAEDSDGGQAARVAARLRRLRMLHQRNFSFKKPAQELEENLEVLTDCSRLNREALRLLSPSEVNKLREKFQRHARHRSDSPVNPTKRCGLRKFPSAGWSSPKFSSPEKKISRQRLRKLSLNLSAQSLSASGDSQKSQRRHARNPEHHSDSSINTARLSSTDFEASSNGPADGRRSKALTKTDFYNSQGIVVLQERLLLLLKDFLCLVPDNTVEDVLKHYIKVEYLLVLANHSSCSVRSAVIRLLETFVKRLSSGDLAAYIKSHYHLHLANQLASYPTDAHMLESCAAWVTGVHSSLDGILRCDWVRIQNRFGLNALLAMMTKPLPQSAVVTEKAFRLFQRIYSTNRDEQLALVESGMLHCCMKALYHMYSNKANAGQAKVEQAIVELLSTIGEKALKSVGHINIVWDILNMLSFYQEKQPNPQVVMGFRSAQAQLQYHWMNMFFCATNVPWNFKVAVMRDSGLSLAETRTRLELLVDRCSQFFTIFDAANYTPTQPEIRFFQLLVSYGISTNQRCNNFIAWGLQPSRPQHLREYIVDALWISCNDEFLPAIIGDGKLIRALLWNCLIKDPQQQQQPENGNLERLCKRLGIQRSDAAWNLEMELERIQELRRSLAEKHSSLLEKTVYKLEALAVSCIESSMVTTRRVAELQNAERKLIMKDMKDYDETDTYTRWLTIIRRMTHEGAPWFSKHRNESSWELDDTEGPSRVHTRLRRCHLDIDKRFFMEDYQQESSRPRAKDLKGFPDPETSPGERLPVPSSSSAASEYTRPLDYLIASYDQQLNISLNSQILYNFPAKYLPVDGEIDGEMIVTDQKIYFIATYRCKYFYVTCDIASITEIWLKRYQHQEKAFEVFLDTNQSLFFSLQNTDDWKIMREVFSDKIVHPPDHTKVQSITQQWREGLLTNWEYLMSLNQIAGRTYNDLMQYPVFPWILANYKSDTLDLADPKNYRKLEKPIAVQLEENEEHYINNYTYMHNTMTNMGSLILKPYHYSSHYSNSGTVLHFLVRVPPFTSYFLRYQDNNFDLPDRTFHSLSTTWCLASRDSPTDVKELIPEFFSLPEMFENFERFNFGCRQSGERVEDVILPPWCGRDPRLFVLIHRQALEAELVRQNIHQWIDLIFGYKQTGEPAVDAINVFHPATYSMFLDSEISDPIERNAVETMVKTYGQMPRQLFKMPHPSSKLLAYNVPSKEVVATVAGLRWGVYLGSPQLPPPQPGYTNKLLGAEYLVAFNNTNVVYGLPRKSCIMQGADTDTFNVVSWGYEDRIVRIQPLSKCHTKPQNLLHNNAFDDITVCGSDMNSNQLWFGHKSGRITVYRCNNAADGGTGAFSGGSGGGGGMSGSLSGRSSKSRSSYVRAMREGMTDLRWHGPSVLVRHKDEITCICLSVEFKIAVTAGRDGIAVIWDLNNWSYIRTIERPAEIHHSPIALVVISPTLGDIVTVHNVPWHQAGDLMSSQSSSTNGPDETTAAGHLTASPSEVISAPLQAPVTSATAPTADECFEVTEENLDDFVNVSINPNGKSILRLHTVNARYVQHIVHEERIHAVCYSYIKEGVGVNVIATAIDGGLVRLWSSWNLSFVCEIATGINNIRSIVYSTHQHLVVLSKESHIKVWESEGLSGSPPKFPQIAYK